MNNNSRSIFSTILANVMRPSLPGIISGIAVHVCIVFLAYQLYSSKVSQNELSLINRSNKIKYEIEQIFNKKNAALASISLSINYDGGIVHFDEVASDIIKRNPRLETIALLPGGKYEYVYPLNDKTRKLLGFDLLKDGIVKLKNRIRDGIHTHQVVYAGPFPGTPYDSVVTGLYPIFLHDKFWGLCVITIPLSRILATVDTIQSKDLNISISNLDPVTQKRYLVYSKDNSSTTRGRKDTYDEKILHNNWRLHVNAPKTGWGSILIIPYLISLLLALLVGGYVNGMVYAKRKLGGAEDALKRYDKKFKSIFENAPIGIAQIDFHTQKLTEANKKFCDLAGVKNHDLIGKGLWAILPEGLYESSRTEFQYALQNGKGELEKSFRYTGKNGAEAWVHANLQPVVDADGKINTLVLVVEDITSTEKAKQALSDSEVRYKSLFEDSPIALWELDFSKAKECLTKNNLLNKDTETLKKYFLNHKDLFIECFRNTTVSLNNEAVKLHEAESKEALVSAFWNKMAEYQLWEIPLIALSAISNNQHSLVTEAITYTQNFEPRNVAYYWNVMPGYEESLSHVTVAMVDITQLKRSQEALEQTNKLLETSENHLRSLFEDSPVALWEQDFSGLRQYFIDNNLMNKSYDEIFHYFAKDATVFEDCYQLFKIYAVNKSGVTLYDAKDKKELMDNIKFLLSSPASMEYIVLALTFLSNGIVSSEHETTIFTLSGKIKHIDYRWNVALGHEQDYSRVIVAMNDISQLKNAELKAQEAAIALQISQQRFRSLFEDSPIALWEEDYSGVQQYLLKKKLWLQPAKVIRNYFEAHPNEVYECIESIKILSANKEALKIYNAKTLDELLLVFGQATQMPESWEVFLIQIAELGSGKTKLRKESTSMNEKGQLLHLDLNWNVLPGYEKSLERVIVSTNDITQIKNSEKEIEAARARLETIINTVDGIVWTADPDTTDYTFVSDNAVTITGYAKEVWINKRGFDTAYMHSEDAATIMPERRMNVKAGIPHTSEYRLITQKGTTKWFRESINFIKQEGQVVSLIGIIVDITGLRMAKDNLQQSLDIVSKQNRQLMQFSYIVSHNLRSHIGNISSLCELLRDPDTNAEEQEAYLGHLYNISKILNDTMDGLNEVTHIQTTTELTIKQLNLKEFIAKTLAILSNVITDKDAIIVSNVRDGYVVAYYQPYLESVLLSFISNALKYSSPKRQPLIKVLLNEEEKVLTIIDNGIGIDLAQHGDKIFGLFKKFTSNPDSRGIGLYVAKNQIEAMGGRVSVESQIDIGTTFKIYFNG